jgi:1-acyl-sn-glycerol-3-phosphate acyltransferase
MKLWWVIGLTATVLAWWAMRALDRAHVADWGGYGINLLDGLNRIFCRRFHRLIADPIPLPATGGAIIAANHTSGLDPLLLFAASMRPVRFLIAQEEYNRWWLRWLLRWIGCIPMDRSVGGQRAFYAVRQALERGEVVGVFPEGGIRMPGAAPLPIKRGSVALAAAAGVPLAPVHIEGVRGAGRTVSAVFLRSHARLTAGDPIVVDEANAGFALARLAAFLQPPS